MVLVQSSLDAGADVNTVDGLGRTALVWAAISDQVGTIRPAVVDGVG